MIDSSNTSGTTGAPSRHEAGLRGDHPLGFRRNTTVGLGRLFGPLPGTRSDAGGRVRQGDICALIIRTIRILPVVHGDQPHGAIPRSWPIQPPPAPDKFRQGLEGWRITRAGLDLHGERARRDIRPLVGKETTRSGASLPLEWEKGHRKDPGISDRCRRSIIGSLPANRACSAFLRTTACRRPSSFPPGGSRSPVPVRDLDPLEERTRSSAGFPYTTTWG